MFAWHPVDVQVHLPTGFQRFNDEVTRERVCFRKGRFLPAQIWVMIRVMIRVNVGLMCPACLVFVRFIGENRKLFCLGR